MTMLRRFDRALALAPDLAEAWLGRGNVACALKRYDDALAAYDRALALKPDLAEVWLGRGKSLRLWHYDEALMLMTTRFRSNLILPKRGLAAATFFRMQAARRCVRRL